MLGLSTHVAQAGDAHAERGVRGAEPIELVESIDERFLGSDGAGKTMVSGETRF